MEIKLKIKISDILNKIPDETKDFLKRILIFSVTVKYGFVAVACCFGLLSMPFGDIISNFNCNIVIKIQTLYNSDIYPYTESYEIENLVIFYSFLAMYYLAKICGIFKKLERYNFFVSLIIIIFLCFLLILIGKINFLESQGFFELGLEYYYTMYTLIPAFFLNRLFIFLGKKYKLCRKIGYYFSFEFYRELFLKFKKRKNENKDEN